MQSFQDYCHVIASLSVSEMNRKRQYFIEKTRARMAERTNTFLSMNGQYKEYVCFVSDTVSGIGVLLLLLPVVFRWRRII